jgi:large subunit ribosomal protein L3
MIGLIARKEGMSRVFTEEGKSVPVTILKIHSNVVSQIKTSEKDGYDAIPNISGGAIRKKSI